MKSSLVEKIYNKWVYLTIASIHIKYISMGRYLKDITKLWGRSEEKKKPMNMPGNKRKLDTHSELQIALY